MVKSPVKYLFGDKLRQVRERKGSTLKEIAGIAGISESLVSQIERNKVSPSVDTLMSIASALSIDPEYLFRDYKSSKKADIIRKNERDSRIINNVVYKQLSVIKGDPENDGIEIFQLEISPGQEKGDMEFGHRGRETGIIIDGQGEMIYGTERYKLSSGDSISFSSDIPHLFKNTGSKIIKAIWIITPPRVFNRS